MKSIKEMSETEREQFFKEIENVIIQNADKLAEYILYFAHKHEYKK